MSENIPVNVIATFNTLGEIKPLWIKLETDDHIIRTVRITKLFMSDKSNYAGFKVNSFTCTIEVENIEKQISLKYMEDTQKWYLQNI